MESYLQNSHQPYFRILPEATGQFEQGDLIGIFTQSDLCAGIAKVEVIDKAFSLTAFGTDIFASDKTGFEYAEPVKFKIFKPTTGQEYPVNHSIIPMALMNLFYS